MTVRKIINQHGYLYDQATGRMFKRESPTNWIDPNTHEPAPNPFEDDPANNIEEESCTTHHSTT